MSQRFDHIKVGAHREPDQVIYAGQGAAAAEEALGSEPAAGASAASAAASGPASEGASAPVPAAASAATTASDPVTTAAPPAPEPDPEAPPASDGFREATLEDLESSRMTLTQRVIIVMAGLATIAFLAWNLISSA